MITSPPIEPKRVISGFVQSTETATRFRSIGRKSINPPFRVIDQVTKAVDGVYSQMLADMAMVAIALANTQGIVVSTIHTADSAWGDLIEDLRKALRRIKTSSKADKRLRIKIANQLRDAQDHYFKEFQQTMPPKLSVGVSIALDKDQVFKQNLEGIQERYLDTAMERIEGEANNLKKMFLAEFSKFIRGKESPDFKDGIQSIMDHLSAQSKKVSRFFARDQFSKFNKALSVSSYESGGVEKVQKGMVGDGRTRPTHRTSAIIAKYGTDIFPIDELPEELSDYQCRCPLYPVFN